MCSGDPAVVPSGLRGYRYWNWNGTDRLGSVAAPGQWDGATAEATCKRYQPSSWWFNGESFAEHASPVQGCTCGIYGWYRPTEARLHVGDVFGVIEASGRVLLGDFGFRAEKARIVAVVTDNPSKIHALKWLGIDTYPDQDALLEAYPPEDVRELIGHDIPDTPPTDLGSRAQAFIQCGISARQVADRFQQLVTEIQNAARQTSTDLNAMAKQITDLLQPASFPDEPKARALELRKRRHTGPAKPRLDGRRA